MYYCTITISESLEFVDNKFISRSYYNMSLLSDEVVTSKFPK